MMFFDTMTPKQAQEVNPLVLAYVGDAVQSLFVRQSLVAEHDLKAGELHKLASQLAEKLWDKLTEEEQSVFLRGRNGKAHHKAKNQSGSDYRKATGLEAVIGYLYLTGNLPRIKELLGEQI